MNAAQAINILRHVPGNYPLCVQIAGKVHEVLNIEYGHEPARTTLIVAHDTPEAIPPEPEATIQELRGEIPPVPVPVVPADALPTLPPMPDQTVPKTMPSIKRHRAKKTDSTTEGAEQ